MHPTIWKMMEPYLQTFKRVFIKEILMATWVDIVNLPGPIIYPRDNNGTNFVCCSWILGMCVNPECRLVHIEGSTLTDKFREMMYQVMGTVFQTCIKQGRVPRGKGPQKRQPDQIRSGQPPPAKKQQGEDKPGASF